MTRILSFIFFLLPLAANALGATEIINKTTGTFRTVILGVTFLFGTIIFLWGLVTFIAKADNPEERKKGKKMMIWGIIGLAVIASAWGLVKILSDFFGIGGIKIPTPRFP